MKLPHIHLSSEAKSTGLALLRALFFAVIDGRISADEVAPLIAAAEAFVVALRKHLPAPSPSV